MKTMNTFLKRLYLLAWISTFLLLTACGATNGTNNNTNNTTNTSCRSNLGPNDVVFNRIDLNADNIADIPITLTFLFDGYRKLVFGQGIALEHFSATKQIPNVELIIEGAGRIVLEDYSSGNLPSQITVGNTVFDGETFIEYLLAGGHFKQQHNTRMQIPINVPPPLFPSPVTNSEMPLNVPPPLLPELIVDGKIPPVEPPPLFPAISSNGQIPLNVPPPLSPEPIVGGQMPPNTPPPLFPNC